MRTLYDINFGIHMDDQDNANIGKYLIHSACLRHFLKFR